MCLVDLYIFINKNENINLFIGSVFGTSVIISETKLYSEKKVKELAKRTLWISNFAKTSDPKYFNVCGIVGAFYFSQNNSNLRNQVLDMDRKIRHRGPDWSEIYSSDNTILANERLGILNPFPSRKVK